MFWSGELLLGSALPEAQSVLVALVLIHQILAPILRLFGATCIAIVQMVCVVGWVVIIFIVCISIMVD